MSETVLTGHRPDERMRHRRRGEAPALPRQASARLKDRTMAAALDCEPCLTCTSLHAIDVRHALGTGMLEEAHNRSPNGIPLMCGGVTIQRGDGLGIFRCPAP
jgi:hypothetical protein